MQGDRRGAYGVLLGKSGGKRPLVRPRHRWEGNRNMYLQSMGCRGIDWIDVNEGRVQVVGCFVCGNEPSGSVKCGEFLDWLRTG
jgi:hypothetical protein